MSLVSVIIPTFNRAQMVREAVDSVLAQTYRPIEVVIVDDGSTDATPQVVAELAATYHDVVRCVRQDNAGPGAARNLGLKHARGDFIQYLDSDDLLAPRKFEVQVAALQANPGAGLAYGITQRLNLDTGETRVWARTAEPIEHIFPDFLMQRGWHTTSPLWRRSACEAIGLWRELNCMEDWEHDLRAGILGIRAVHVNEVGAVARDHAGVRASGMHTGFTAELMRDFFLAHEAVWALMREHNLRDWTYLQGFARKMFWVARMCGERGLLAEADTALAMAREMVGSRHISYELRLYGVAVRLLGWPRAVRWSEGARALIKANGAATHA
jgi:glycosyltransferase involved in cell wall biosynthesis